MIKVVVISDTHISAFEDLPKKLLKALKGVEVLLHAGDLASLSVLKGLQTIVPKVYAVWGNMDPPELKRALEDKQIVQIGGLRIGLTHGMGAPFNLLQTVKEKFKNDELDCIVYGHSHTAHNEIHGDTLFFNPGSPTDKLFAPYNSYGILEIDKKITGKIIKI